MENLKNFNSNEESGSVLVVSLWTITILTLLAIGVAFATRVELRLTSYQWDEMRLIQGAKSGVAMAVASLRDQSVSFSALNQSWSQNPDWFHDKAVGEYQITLTHMVRNQRGEEQILYGLEDELGRINLNHASEDILKKLFDGNGTLAAAVLDWLDADDSPRPGGVENSNYQSRPTPYSCRNGPFESIEEVHLVQGMTPDLFAKIKDLVTVYGPGQINLNTAHPEVLKIRGMDETLLAYVLGFRHGKDGVDGTKDDGVFSSIETAVNELESGQPLTAPIRQAFTTLLQQGMFAVKTDHYRAHIRVQLTDAIPSRQFTIIFSAIPGSDGRILYWKEN